MGAIPSEEINLILEQLRVMRAETNARFNAIEARFDEVDARFKEIGQEIADIKRELRGMKLNTIAEVYKANLTVASFLDHEHRTQELERKSS